MTILDNLELDDYLYLDLPNDQDLSLAEARLGVKFPYLFWEALKIGAGKSIDNLSVQTDSGYKPSFRCLYHPYLDTDEPHALSVEDLAALGYGQKLLVFSDSGGVRYCLDYRKDERNPPVVLFVPTEEEGSESAISRLADDFEDFLFKYLVRRK